MAERPRRARPAKGGDTVEVARFGARPPRRAAASTPAAAGGAQAAEGRLRPQAQARRQAILDAALTVFAAQGFEAARLDDVAARAGVAKGTLYLYFKDKEALFEEVVRSAISPILERMNGLAALPDVPFDTALEALFAMFEKEVLGTQRKLLIRLIIAEGP